MLILGRNLYPALLEEMKGKKDIIIDPEIAEEMGIDIDPSNSEPKITFRRDVTERLKVWIALANLVHQIEKKDDEGTNPREKPIFEIYARRGINAGRLKFLVGGEFGGVGGNIDLDRGATISVGAISDQLPERQINVSDSEEVPTGRLLASGVDRIDSLGNDEAELQGEYSFDWGEGG